MNPGFSRHRRTGHCVATFASYEADLLRSLSRQLVELLHSEAGTTIQRDPFEQLMDLSGPTDAPDDPVLARLLPTAYPGDEEASADFRRFTESGLRNHKAAAASTLVDTLEEAGLPAAPMDGLFVDVELDEGQAMSWLRALTDMRLAIATRLGIEDDDEARWAELPDDDPQVQVYELYQWLGFIQETLVAAAFV